MADQQISQTANAETNTPPSSTSSSYSLDSFIPSKTTLTYISVTTLVCGAVGYYYYKR